MHVSSVENEGYFRRIGRVCVIVKPQPGAGLQPASRGQVRCALSGWGRGAGAGSWRRVNGIRVEEHWFAKACVFCILSFLFF